MVVEQLATDLYKGFRSSDIRFDNVHLLAEYVHQAQCLVNSAAATQSESKRLLVGALTASREGVQRLTGAGNAFGATVDGKTAEIITGITACLDQIIGAGNEFVIKTAESIKTPAAKLISAATRLEEAAEKADKKRLEALDALLKLVDYQTDLAAYLADITVYETEVFRRCAAKAAETVANRGLWSRVSEVFSPSPVPAVMMPKKLSRPAMKKEKTT